MMTDLAASECFSNSKVRFHILETNMRVSEDGSTEDGIHDRVESSRSEWSYRQRYQSGGY